MISRLRVAAWGLLLILLAAVLFLFSNSVGTAGAAGSGSPLYVDPTPTPQWYTVGKGESTATSDGTIGATYGDVINVPADSTNEAIVIYMEKNCPTGSNNHWAKGRWEEGAGWTTFFNSQTCGYDDWKWYYGNNNYDLTTVGNAVGSLYPGLSGEPSSGTYAFWNDTSQFQAYTEQGTGGDAGFQSIIEVYAVNFGQPECTEADPEEREALSTGLLIGTDEVGELFDLVEGQDYLLYTSDGPWNDGTDDRYDAALRFFDGESWGEWVSIESYEGDTLCDDSFLDANGAAVAFTADADQEQIQFRVNDTDTEFDDNSGDLFYFWLGGEGSGQNCGVNWSLDNLVGSVTVDTSDGSYQQMLGPSGNYAIMTEGLYGMLVTGTYTDNGADADDVRISDFPEGSGNFDNWEDVNFFVGTEHCEVEEEGNNQYYGSAREDFYLDSKTYGFGQAYPLATANDNNSNAADNSGTIDVDLYTSSYTAPASDCSTKYDRGTWMDSLVVMADNKDGLKAPIQYNGLVPGQYYYIESQGAGYNQNGYTSWDFQIGIDVNENTPQAGLVNMSWYDPEVYADCYTDLDGDHTGYYFLAGKEHIYLRAVPDVFADWDDNTGSVKFNLYGAVPKEVPAGEDCADWFDLDTKVWYGSVSALSTSGTSIDYSVFDAGEEYAIKIVSPAYNDPDGTGKTGEIRRSMPGSGAVSYSSFEDWEAGLCYEQESDYDVVYFEAADYSDYEIRATDPDNNTASTLYYEVWGTAREREPVLGCELEDYGDVDTWYVIKESGIVYANNDGMSGDPSVLANNFEEGNRYKIQVDYINGTPDTVSENYNLEISYDNGGTWVALADWVDCWVDLEDPAARGYFTTPVTGAGPYLLRVHDAGGDWIDNAGGLQVKMWVDSQDADPGDVGDFYDVVTKEWGTGCSAVCVVPGWLEIGQWVEYARCRLTRWLAWCPWHADALKAMSDEFYGVEPFGTIMELIGLGRAIRAEVYAYSWTDEGGGGEVAQFQEVENFIFYEGEGGGGDIPIVGDDSIWGSGEIELTPDTGYSYSTECDNLLADSMGARLSTPICFTVNIIDQLGLRTWFQLLWDIGMLFVLFRYIKANWVDKNT